MKTKKILFYLLAGLLGGCIPVLSLHPLYNEKDVVFDEKLLGSWVEDPNSPETTCEFKRADTNDNAYRLIFSDKEGRKGLFVAYLVKLKDKLFLDVCSATWEQQLEQQDPNNVNFLVYNYYNAFFLIPAHTFIKINSVEPQLKMQVTDDEKMKEFLKADPDAVKHEFLEEGLGPGHGLRSILTASTKELQAFILKYADNPRVFTDAIVLGRKKAADPNVPDGLKPHKTQK